MSILDQILGRTNKAPVPVATPEWPELDGRLAVRRLSPQERVEFYSAAGKQEANSGAAFVAFVPLAVFTKLGWPLVPPLFGVAALYMAASYGIFMLGLRRYESGNRIGMRV